MLRKLIALVGDGTLIADTPQGRGLLRQIEGAATALELLTRSETAEQNDD